MSRTVSEWIHTLKPAPWQTSSRSSLVLWKRPLRFSIVSSEKSSFINMPLVHNFRALYSDKTCCLSLKFRNLAIIVLLLFATPSITVFPLRFLRSISMSRCNCRWSLMISCNFFSLCDHDSFSSSIIPSILRLFLRLRFSKSFSLSLISFKSGITGCFCCCCWSFWFCKGFEIFFLLISMKL